MNLVVGWNTIEDVELIIFDKDGTLIDLYPYWSHVVKRRAEAVIKLLGLDVCYKRRLLESMGLDVANHCFKPEGPIGVKRRSDVLKALEDCLVSLDYSRSKSKEACEYAFITADAQVPTGPDVLKVIPGVRTFFNSICWKSKVAIATADNTARANIMMDAVGLKGIDLVVGSDAVVKGKPDPEIVHFILNKLGVDAKHTVMVGDTVGDLVCGQKAGLLACIGVTTGTTPRDVLAKHSPHIVSTLGSIDVVP